MSTTPLDTNFKDDILASSNAKRKYQMTYNDDGTVSFQDVTAYSQMGSAFGAKEVNEERAAINKINSDRIVTLDEIDLVTEPGFFVDAMAVKELNRKLVFLDQNAQNSSVNGWTLIRNGNIVTFKHNKVLSGVIAGHSYSNQGKIPEGYRPAIDITLPGDRIIGATITGSFYVSIGPAGNTNFVSDGNHNENQSYVASGAYITSDLFPLNDIPKVEI